MIAVSRAPRMLASSAAPVPLTPRECLPGRDDLPWLSATPVLVLEVLAGADEADEPGRATAEQLAYVIYTAPPASQG
jgi:hypothetical protein